MWCHEHFNINPDVVTFSKKMQLGGYYHSKALKPAQAYRVFNTWMGDPGKLLILEQILKVIERDHLLANVNKVGKKLQNGLLDAQKEFPHLLNSTRGRGTFLAINCANSNLRDDLVGRLRANGRCMNVMIKIHICFTDSIRLILGVQSGGCGDLAIRFRPALTFEEHHVDIFLDRFRQVLKDTK